MILYKILEKASSKFNRYFIVFAYPVSSWKLIQRGALAKERYITLKTIRQGILSGYIPVHKDQIIPSSYSTLVVKGQDILAYESQPITSDLDIFYIQRAENEDVFSNDSYGYITSFEFEFIEYINNQVSQVLGRKIKLITHGPYCNLPQPRKTDIVFPFQLIQPNTKAFCLHSLKDMYSQCKSLRCIETWRD